MAANKKNFDMQIKLLMIGDSGVGKTCLLMQYASNTFIKTFITTIGIDFKIKTVNVCGKTVKLQIWDTAGQERFRTITTSYVRGSEGILLVYDVTDRNSFESISSWMEQISQHADSSVNKILIGNKCDLEAQRAVSTEEGKKLAEKFGIPFAETSAQTNTNVDEAFMSLAEAVVKRKTEEAGALDYKAEKSETVKISSSDKKEGKKGG
ncbi:hypothetical protein WA171_002234, partial [Blastocystis sp. BT1]